MKRVIIFFFVSFVALSLFSQDWRRAKYMMPVPEYLVSLNVGGKMMLGENADLNPWGMGFNASYQYKTGKKEGLLTVGHGFGGSIGLTYFPGKSVRLESIGLPWDSKFTSYYSFSYVPIMLSYNFYLIHNNANFFIGIDAGVQMMIREKDYKNTIISYYVGTNDIAITHFLPSGSLYLGCMYEISTNWRIQARVGAEYVHGYTFDATTPFYYRDIDGNYVQSSSFGKLKTKPLLNVFASVGVTYSL
ncbi:MAG: hypothetical protein LBM25_01165 [Bacteroidales bacterium]|jgi:hypothetical protein|nr:hypothetical protein [Bacteroidales bacterium]